MNFKLQTSHFKLPSVPTGSRTRIAKQTKHPASPCSFICFLIAFNDPLGCEKFTEIDRRSENQIVLDIALPTELQHPCRR